jgi:hypothetical protein
LKVKYDTLEELQTKVDSAKAKKDREAKEAKEAKATKGDQPKPKDTKAKESESMHKAH